LSGSSTGVFADRGSYAAGRDLHIGIPPEQLPSLIAAAVGPIERRNSEQQAIIGSLGERLGTSEGIINAVLRALEPHVGVLTPDGLAAKILELVIERQQLLQHRASHSPDPDRGLAELDRALTAALEVGDDAQAQSLLQLKRDLKLAASSRRGEAAARLNEDATRDRLEAVEAEAELGKLALGSADYLAAARSFEAAAGFLPDDGAFLKARWDYLEQAADALSRQGETFGDESAFVKALKLYMSLVQLKKLPDTDIADYAGTLNAFGNSLTRSGALRAHTVRLEMAVNSHRAALAIVSRERLPHVWISTQFCLGNALKTLGEHKGDGALLEEAIAAFHSALEQNDCLPSVNQKVVDLQHGLKGAIMNSLAATLYATGQRENSITRLEEAAEAFRLATADRHLEFGSPEWAIRQNNLGNALQEIGIRKCKRAYLEQAVQVRMTALKALPRGSAPLVWAKIQSCLGDTFRGIARLEEDAGYLEQSINAYRLALNEYTHDRTPLDWARTQNNLAAALWWLGETEEGTETLEAALGAYRIVEPETRDQAPLDWARKQHNIALILEELGLRHGDHVFIAEAISNLEGARVEIGVAGDAGWFTKADADLERMKRVLGEFDDAAR